MNKPGDPEPHSPKSNQPDENSSSQQSNVKTSSNSKPFREGSAKDLHNVIERKRKARISYWISKLIEELPNKDPRRETIIAVLERAYEYIKQLKNNDEKMMDQKLPAVSRSEMKKLQENNRQMQSLLTRYSTLLKMAGISLNAVPSDIEINSCKNHKIPQHQRHLLLSSRPILPKPYHEKSVDTNREVENDQSTVSSDSAKDSVNDARVGASKEPDSHKSPSRGSSDTGNINSNSSRSNINLPINSHPLGSHVESKSVSSSGALIDRVASTSKSAAQVVTSKESRVAKILPHIKTTDGLITFPQVIAPNTPQIVILRSNDNTGVPSTFNSHVTSSNSIIGGNSNLALTGSGNLILAPQLLGLSASPTVVLPSGQIIMTQGAMSTSCTSASSSSLIFPSTFLNQSLTSTLNSSNSMSPSLSSASPTISAVNHCNNQETDQQSSSQPSNSLYSVDGDVNASFDDDVQVIDDENHTPMTNDSEMNSPASSNSKTNDNHKEMRDQGTSASRCYINRTEENSQTESVSEKPASQSHGQIYSSASSTGCMKTRHVKVTSLTSLSKKKRKLTMSKKFISHKKRRENFIPKRQVSQAKYLIEQAVKSIQMHLHTSNKVNCKRNNSKKQKITSNNINNEMLSSPAPVTTDILMLDNLSESNSALSPSSVNSTSNSSLPNFLCLSPTADQLSDFLQPKCASPVSHNDTVSTVNSEVTSNINTCSKRSDLDNSRNNNSNTPIISAVSTASPSISSISNFLNESTHQDKQQQQQTRKQPRHTRRSAAVHLHSQTFQPSSHQQQQQQQQTQQEQLTHSQSQQQTRRSSYMAESLIRQQPVVASARSQMANLTPHDVTFTSPVNTHGNGASSRSTNSANNSSHSQPQQQQQQQHTEQEASQLSNLYGDSNDHHTRTYSSPNVTSNRGSISYSAERLINASQNSSSSSSSSNRRDESTSSILTRHSFSGSNLFFDPPANLLPSNDLFSFNQSDSRTPGLSLAPVANDSTASHSFESSTTASFNPPCFSSAGRNYLSPVPAVTHTPALICAPISSASASSTSLSSSVSTSSAFPSFSAPSTAQSGVFSFPPLTTSHHLSPTHHSACNNNHPKSTQRTPSSSSNGIMNNSLSSINPFAISSDFNGSCNPSFISVDATTASPSNHYPYIRNSVSSSVTSSSSMRSSADTSSAHVFPLSTSSMASFTHTIAPSSSSSLTTPCVSASATAAVASLPPPPNPYLISASANCSSSSNNTSSIASSPFAPLSIGSSTCSSYDSSRMPPLFSNALTEQWAASLHTTAPVSRRLTDQRNSIATSHSNGSSSSHHGKSSKNHETASSSSSTSAAAAASSSSSSASSSSPSSASTASSTSTSSTAATTSTVDSCNTSKGSNVVKKNIATSNSNKGSHNIIHVNHQSSPNQSGRNNIHQLNSHQLNCNTHMNTNGHGNRRISGTSNSLSHSTASSNSLTMYPFSPNDSRMIHCNQNRLLHQMLPPSAPNPSNDTNVTNSTGNSNGNGTSSTNNGNNGNNNNGSTNVHSSSASSSITSHARSERTDGNFNYSNNTSTSNNTTNSSNGGTSTNNRPRTVVSSRSNATNGTSSSSSAPITSSNRTSGVTSSSSSSSSLVSTSTSTSTSASSSSSSSSSTLPTTSVSSASHSITPVSSVISSPSSSVTLFAAVAAAAAAPLIAAADSTPLTASSSTASIPFTLTGVPTHPPANSTGFRFSNIFSDLLRPTSASAATAAAAAAAASNDVNHFTHASSHLTHQSSHLHPQSQASASHSPGNCFHGMSNHHHAHHHHHHHPNHHPHHHHLHHHQQQSVANSETSLSQSHQIHSVLTLDENNTPTTDPSTLAPQFTGDCYNHRQSINQTSFSSNGNLYPF